jgi:hypothetical protein
MELFDWLGIFLIVGNLVFYIAVIYALVREFVKSLWRLFYERMSVS